MRENNCHTYTVIDEVGNVAIVSCIHCIFIIHIIQVKQVGGAFFIVDMPSPFCFFCSDDLSYAVT